MAVDDDSVFEDEKTLWEGSIPSEFGLLRQLEVFILPGMAVSGSLDGLFSQMPNLITLSIENNMLSGPIPDALAIDSPNLGIIRLDRNALNGTIPSSLGSLPNLFDLDLASNEMTGQVPSELGLLPNIRE